MPQGAQVVQDKNMATTAVLNMTGSGTAIKTSAARVARITVVAASTTAGAVYDCAAIGSTAAGNLVFTIPATVGVYMLDWPMKSGVSVFPGAGMTLAVSLA